MRESLYFITLMRRNMNKTLPLLVSAGALILILRHYRSMFGYQLWEHGRTGQETLLRVREYPSKIWRKKGGIIFARRILSA